MPSLPPMPFLTDNSSEGRIMATAAAGAINKPSTSTPNPANEPLHPTSNAADLDVQISEEIGTKNSLLQCICLCLYCDNLYA